MSAPHFIRRTWRRTSKKICESNGFPLGFRIVLLTEDRRARRDDLLVRSGDFSWYPADFSVRTFLDEIMENEVRDPESIYWMEAELRDHLNRPINPDLTLWYVRHMRGASGMQSRICQKRHDIVSDLESEIEQAIALLLEDDLWHVNDPDCDVLLETLVMYLTLRLTTNQLERFFVLLRRGGPIGKLLTSTVSTNSSYGSSLKGRSQLYTIALSSSSSRRILVCAENMFAMPCQVGSVLSS